MFAYSFNSAVFGFTGVVNLRVSKRCQT